MRALRFALLVVALGFLATGAARAADYSKTVGGYTIYLGVLPAGVLFLYRPDHGDPTVHSGPRFGDAHHVLVGLVDATRGSRIDDAEITARIVPTKGEPQERRLERMSVEGGDGVWQLFRAAPRSSLPHRPDDSAPWIAERGQSVVRLCASPMRRAACEENVECQRTLRRHKRGSRHERICFAASRRTGTCQRPGYTTFAAATARRSIMKRILMAALTGLALAMPRVAFTAPDEAQKVLILRAQEAKQKLAAAQAAWGRERQRLIQEHLNLMQDVVMRMRTAKPPDGLTPQQMREWIDEHLKLMDLMTGQMMDEHHLMLQGFGK